MKKFSDKNLKITLSGYYGFDNFGDEAILGVLSKKMLELSDNVCAISKNPTKTAELYGVKTIPFFAIPQIIKRIFESDVLVSGGGSLLQDVTSLKSLLYYLFIINTALFFRKKVIIFAQGLGPINNRFGAFLTKNTLKKCTLVSVRDRKSKLLLHLWGIEADLVCDPLFGLELPAATPQNIVGIQLRSFKTLKDNLLDKLAIQVNKEFEDKKIQIFSFQDSLDLDVCKKFEKLLKNINPNLQTELVYSQTSAEILDKFSKLEYLIAMRFHANLIAIKYGIKTLAINYDIKVEKLAEDAQIPYLSMSADEDYDCMFSQLKSIDCKHLKDFAQTKDFDWTKIIKNVNK